MKPKAPKAKKLTQAELNKEHHFSFKIADFNTMLARMKPQEKTMYLKGFKDALGFVESFFIIANDAHNLAIEANLDDSQDN